MCVLGAAVLLRPLAAAVPVWALAAAVPLWPLTREPPFVERPAPRGELSKVVRRREFVPVAASVNQKNRT